MNFMNARKNRGSIAAVTGPYDIQKSLAGMAPIVLGCCN
jgi:hypothetical protein